MATAPPPQKLNALTSLRFIAACGIVVMHCGGHFGLPADMTWGNRIPSYLGVSFFFVLSGFILTYVYPGLDSAAACGRFLLARFARVWPCHVLALLLYCVINGITLDTIRRQGLLPQYLANLGMVHAWIPLKSFYMVASCPSWSISAEFGFYFLFPLLIWRLDRTWHVKLAACLLLLIGAAVACHLGDIPYESNSGVTANGLLYMNPLARLFEFTLGMTVALFWRRWSPRIRLGVRGGTALELAVAALVAANAYFWTDIADGFIALTGTAPQLRIFFSHWSTCLSFAALVFVAALGRGWVTRALSWSGLVLLGEISYAVYLLHFPLLGYVYYRGSSLAAYPDAMVLAGFVIVLLALSHASWVLIEVPSRRFLIGLWPKPGATPRPAQVARPPRWRPTPAGLALVAELLLVGSVISAVERPPYSILPDSKAVALRARGRPEARDVRFGDRYVLRDVLMTETKKGLEVGLMWQSRRAQPLDCYVALQLCDAQGKVLVNTSYVQDPRRRSVEKGTIWLETNLIPRHRIEEAGGLGRVNLAIGIGPISEVPQPVYQPDRGPRDGGNWRLLLKTAETALAPGDLRKR